MKTKFFSTYLATSVLMLFCYGAIVRVQSSRRQMPSLTGGSFPAFKMPSFPGFGSGSLPGFGGLAGLAAPSTTEASTPKSSSKSSAKGGSNCSSYVIISTRGTSEMQGPSMAFTSINSQVMSAVPGGKLVNTVYPAGMMQDSSQGTKFIIAQVTANPNQCYVLEGYSQGAAATVNAMNGLTGAAMDAVKAVFLVGNPLHKSGLACNVDSNGGTSTRNVNGISANFGLGGIPAAWVGKTLDVCASGDGICDSMHGFGVNMQHLSYPTNTKVQQMGVAFIKSGLTGQAKK